MKNNNTQTAQAELNLTRSDLECVVWDVYKEAHGCRPRGLKFELYSDSELEAYIADLDAVVAAAAEYEQIEAEHYAHVRSYEDDMAQLGQWGEDDALEEIQDDISSGRSGHIFSNALTSRAELVA